MGLLQSNALNYVRYVLGALDITPTALAAKAGLASTTLTRALNKSDHPFSLSISTIDRIAAATGIDPLPFLAFSGRPRPALLPPLSAIELFTALKPVFVDIQRVFDNPLLERPIAIELSVLMTSAMLGIASGVMVGGDPSSDGLPAQQFALSEVLRHLELGGITPSKTGTMQ